MPFSDMPSPPDTRSYGRFQLPPQGVSDVSPVGLGLNPVQQPQQKFSPKPGLFSRVRSLFAGGRGYAATGGPGAGFAGK